MLSGVGKYRWIKKRGTFICALESNYVWQKVATVANLVLGSFW